MRTAQETAWYVNGANAFEARFAAAAKDVIAQVDMEAYHADWTLPVSCSLQSADKSHNRNPSGNPG